MSAPTSDVPSQPVLLVERPAVMQPQFVLLVEQQAATASALLPVEQIVASAPMSDLESGSVLLEQQAVMPPRSVLLVEQQAVIAPCRWWGSRR